MADIDYSKLSDEELEKLAGGSGDHDLSNMTDEQLEALANQPQQVEKETPPYIPPAIAGGAAAWQVGVPAAEVVGGATLAKGVYDILKNKKVPDIAAKVQQFAGMTPAQKWNEKMHGVNLPQGEMDKPSFDIGQSMKQTIGPGGELQGGNIRGGVMIGPEAERQIAAQEAAQKAAAMDAEIQRQANRTVRQKMAEGWNITKEKMTPQSDVGRLLLKKPLTAAKIIPGTFGVGYNAADLYNRSMEGNVPQAAIAGAGTVGSVASMIPHKKTGRLGMAAAIGAPILNAAIDTFSNKPQGYAEGHSVRNKKDLAFEALKAAKNILMPAEPKIIRASEALAPHEGKYLGLTQTDNFGVHGERMGGNQFPAFQQTKPKHAEDRVVWMNDSEKHANDIIKASHNRDKPLVWSTYIGAPDQLKSNKTVTQHVYDQFLKGNWTPEQYAAINNRIATLTKGKDKPLVFSQPFDIRDKFAAQEVGMDTFERRGALASLLGMGEGTRKGKQYMGMPEYQDILASHRDPLTEGVPTSSVGTRLFEVDPTPSKFSQEYHPDYNWTVHGQDQGVSFKPVEQKLIVPDWYNEYKSRFPNLEPHGNAWFSYMKQPQHITEDYLRGLEEAGHAEGGRIQHMAAGKLAGGLSMMPKKQQEEMTQLERQHNYFANRPMYQKAEMVGDALSGVPELAASFHPGFGLGYAGSALYDAFANTGDYGGAAVDTMFNAPGVLKPVGAALKAAAPMARAALPYVGGLGALGAADAAEAGGGKGGTMKRMMDDVMQGFAPKTAKEITPGAPHTYGPQATGSWMRDYQPSGTGLPSTPEEWNMLAQARQAAQNQVDYSMGNTGPNKPDLVQYWGKYRKGTPEERAAQRQSDNDTIRMLMKMRGMD